MSSPTASVKDLDLDFLPLIYEIVRCMEKESNDPNQTNKLPSREQSDCHQKIADLRRKFQESRDILMKINGIGLTKEEQKKKFDSLKQQLALKKELLQKYKHSCPIDSQTSI